MTDLTLAVLFFSMLLAPCCLATRSVQRRETDTAASCETTDPRSFRSESQLIEIDRRLLAQQRSRELYLRTQPVTPSSAQPARGDQEDVVAFLRRHRAPSNVVLITGSR